MTRPDDVEVSVVVPVLNGASTLDELHERLTTTLDACADGHRIIVVDDGSTDESWAIMCRLAAADPRVDAIRLSRNSGHAGAIAAGFSVATGKIVATIDVDLETAPEDIGLLVDAVRNGADLASGRRTARRVWHREIGSRLFNSHARRRGIPLRDIGCGMNAVRREIAHEYVECATGRRTLIKPLLWSLSRTVIEIDVQSQRPSGSHLRFGDLVTFWVEFDAFRGRPPWFRMSLFGVAAALLVPVELVVAVVALDGDSRWLMMALAALTLLAAVAVTSIGLLAGVLLRAIGSPRAAWFRIAERVPPRPDT